MVSGVVVGVADRSKGGGRHAYAPADKAGEARAAGVPGVRADAAGGDWNSNALSVSEARRGAVACDHAWLGHVRC